MTSAEELHKRTAVRIIAQQREPHATPAAGDPAPLLIDAIEKDIEDMQRTPRSGVGMCHEQGKTAVYLSEDKQYIVHEPPNGPMTRKRLPPAPADRSR